MFPSPIQRIIDQVDALRDQVDDHWQIPADAARVLAQLVRMARAMSICEIGHSYGFSTLHLAAAASEHGGHVHSFDLSEKKHEAAARHLEQAGLGGSVTLHLGDARELVRAFVPEAPYDFVFVDATKDQSLDYLAAVRPRLAPRCWMVTDNIRTHADELAPFVEELCRISGGRTCPLPVGNGFELTLVEAER